MIDHNGNTARKKLEHCNAFLLNVKRLGLAVNRHFWPAQISKQNSNNKKSDFTKSSRYIPIAPCFDSKLKF